MTAIVAWHDREQTVVVADRLESGDNVRHIGGLPKIKKYGDFIIGAAGDSGSCNLLVHNDLPKKTSKQSDERYIVSVLPRYWRKQATTESVDLSEVTVMVVGHSGIWTADGPGFGFSKVASPYWAIGSGAECALGALAAQRRTGSVTRRLQQVVEIASRYVASVGPDTDMEAL